MMRIAIALTLIGALLAPSAEAKTRNGSIAPYIELGQVLTFDVNGSDVLTYSALAAGIDASIQTKRTQVQLSYRYEHRFSESGRLTDSDIHSGLARANVALRRGLTIEGGALAARARSDARGAAPGLLVGNVANISQVYSLYAGPSLGTHIGQVGVSGSYLYGYTKVEAPGFTGVDPNQPRLDVYDASHNQMAQASLNVKSGVILPVGLTVSGAWERDEASQLSQRFDGKYARGDVIWPVLPTLALTAGAGYEKIEVSQRDPLLDGSNQPVVDARGRFVADTSTPRHIAYNFDGLYYDAGVVWRPSPRTSLTARLGERYGSTSFTGSFTYQPNRSVAAAISVYDGVTTFGRQLRDGIGNLPTSFSTSPSILGQDYNGCVFGAGGSDSGSGSAGGCLNGVFQSISTAAFRARGVDGVVTVSRGRLRYGLGAGYANRTYLAGNGAGAFSIDDVTDESFYIQAFAGVALDNRTSVDVNAYGNYYSSGIAGAPGVYGVGGAASIARRYGRLSARGAVGIYSFAQDGAQAVVSVNAAIGARYQF